MIIINNAESHLEITWKLLRSEFTDKQVPNVWSLRYEGKRNVGRLDVDGRSNSCVSNRSQMPDTRFNRNVIDC